MKRKRFVKLMMSIGVQRNEANLIALLVNGRYRKMRKKSPLCAECKHLTITRCNWTNANRYTGGPRAACMCKHPNADRSFKDICPRSPRMPGFIGYTEKGGDVPTIKTSPKWCPIKEEAVKN